MSDPVIVLLQELKTLCRLLTVLTISDRWFCALPFPFVLFCPDPSYHDFMAQSHLATWYFQALGTCSLLWFEQHPRVRQLPRSPEAQLVCCAPARLADTGGPSKAEQLWAARERLGPKLPPPPCPLLPGWALSSPQKQDAESGGRPTKACDFGVRRTAPQRSVAWPDCHGLGARPAL